MGLLNLPLFSSVYCRGPLVMAATVCVLFGIYLTVKGFKPASITSERILHAA